MCALFFEQQRGGGAFHFPVRFIILNSLVFVPWLLWGSRGDVIFSKASSTKTSYHYPYSLDT